MKKRIFAKSSFCLFALFATQELQAAPYVYSNHSSSYGSPTSQLLSTRTYNAEEEMVSEGDCDGKLTNYTYDTSGQLSMIQDRDGNYIHNTYNDHEALQTSWADHLATNAALGRDATNVLKLAYDSGNDQLTVSTYHQDLQSAAETTKEAYNVAGELTTKTYVSDGDKTQQYQYNLDGSVHVFTNVLGQQATYNYTPMKQLQSVNFENDITTYTYDTFGRKSTETRPNGVTTTWIYNDYNSLIGIKDTNTQGTLNQIGYTYGPNGNVHTQTLPQNTTYTYQYNNLNQLKDYVCTGGLCAKDARGNVISSDEYTYGLNNQIETIKEKNTKGEINTVTYQYYTDHPDRLKSISSSDNSLGQMGTMIYDNNGNVTTDSKGDTLSYDALNQMLNIKDPSGDLIESYGYSVDGKVNQETPAKQSPIREYTAGKSPHITVKIQEGKATSYAIGTDRIAQYYFANATKNDGVPSNVQYYLYDQRGSVTNVLSNVAQNTQTNTSGNSNIFYLYSPLGYLSKTGNVKSQKDTVADIQNNTFGFIGESLSPSSGLMIMGGYRAYDPVTGVFMKQDSYSPFQGPGTFNGFNYGAGNPILFTDPTGHMSNLAWLLIGAGVALLTGGVAGVMAESYGTLISGLAGGVVGSVGGDTVTAVQDAVEHKTFSWESAGINLAVGVAMGGIAGKLAGVDGELPDPETVSAIETYDIPYNIHSRVTRATEAEGDQATILQGGTGRALVGHGAYFRRFGFTRIPRGVTLVAPAQEQSLPSSIGHYMELGYKAFSRSQPVSFVKYGPGDLAPNYFLSPPTGLSYFRNSIVVERDTTLEKMLAGREGEWWLVACTREHTCPSGLALDSDGI